MFGEQNFVNVIFSETVICKACVDEALGDMTAIKEDSITFGLKIFKLQCRHCTSMAQLDQFRIHTTRRHPVGPGPAPGPAHFERYYGYTKQYRKQYCRN